MTITNSNNDGSAPGPYEESWEPDVATKIWELVQAKEKDESAKYPFCMVSLSGIPGSGKSVSSLLLANILEERGCSTMICPHDGYHYPLDYLKTFPDAEDAIYRRGAPDTFDPQALLRDLMLIRAGNSGDNGKDSSEGEEWQTISLPGFDHAKGDPEPGIHLFDRSIHKVVICEGLYLLHDKDGWEEIASLFDLKIVIESDVDSCVERLKIRNLCIPGYTPEEIAKRCEEVDRVNAMTVMASKHCADIVVQSRSKVIQTNIDKNEATSSQGLALAMLAQKDTDEVDTNHEHADWTMDINTHQRSPMVSRCNSPVPGTSTTSTNPKPTPASQFVGSWEPEIADRICGVVDKGSDPTDGGAFKLPYMVALVGIPGGGKSVSAMLLASILEDRGFPTMICPHDGYHYPLEYLRTFPDAEDAIYRRGAPDTFDPRALLRDLVRIRDGDEELIKLPAFDHATGDPEPDTHIFDRNQHKIVLCEGLYLLHDKDGWEEIASMFNFSIFMNADVDVCVERVKIRNQCIPGYTPEEIEERCERVDRKNALTVLQSKAHADIVVDSMALKR
ncbi:dependent kinase YFH7 [Seminavis robusta]|uniref:Dependent kinase YFH7 n=1 Tax=Seminavis robusta TaxID=568900 RepID=A0A9N8EHX6_9STRA|nr:dependent kinase YFH7 [Seminavis robusta]|eukprot:Sro1220_g253500.1 dependent kinase YFH7 (561) ;mRNA; f:4930-6612